MDINNITPNIITKYGKEFSVVKIPYCFKLLIHELTAINVQMRLITADNIDQLTLTGNTNLSEIMKGEPVVSTNNLLSKKNGNLEKLNELEAEYNKSMSNYNSRLKVLKQKFNKLNGQKPVNSYYKKELSELRNTYLSNKETYYDLSKEIYKDEIDQIIEKLDELKVNYNSALQSKKLSDIDKIKLDYNKYLKLYKKYTGDEYNVLLEDLQNIELPIPETSVLVKEPLEKQSKPSVNVLDDSKQPFLVKKVGSEPSPASSENNNESSTNEGTNNESSTNKSTTNEGTNNESNNESNKS